VLARLPSVVGDGLDEKLVITKLLDAVRAGVLAGDVKCVEAASKATVENAVALAVELGFARREGKQLLSPASVTSEAVVDADSSREALVELLSRC
jgi:hypothetical protein